MIPELQILIEALGFACAVLVAGWLGVMAWRTVTRREPREQVGDPSPTSGDPSTVRADPSAGSAALAGGRDLVSRSGVVAGILGSVLIVASAAWPSGSGGLSLFRSGDPSSVFDGSSAEALYVGAPASPAVTAAAARRYEHAAEPLRSLASPIGSDHSDPWSGDTSGGTDGGGAGGPSEGPGPRPGPDPSPAPSPSPSPAPSPSPSPDPSPSPSPEPSPSPSPSSSPTETPPGPPCDREDPPPSCD